MMREMLVPYPYPLLYGLLLFTAYDTVLFEALF